MRAAIAIVIATLPLGLGYGPVLAQTPGGDVPALESIRMIDALTGWAVTHEPGAERLLRTTDGGTQWRDVTPLNSSGQRIAFSRVDVLTSLIAWALSGTRIFHTVDGGRTWRNVTSPALRSIHFINARDGWGLAGAGVAGSMEVDIYRSADGGETWTKVESTRLDNESDGLPFAGEKGDVTFLNATTGWVTGYVSTPDWMYLYVSHNGGHTWRQQNLPLPPQMTPHWNDETTPPTFFTPRDGILPVFYSILNKSYLPVESVLVFYVTQDGGATWTYTTPVPVTKWDRASSFVDGNHGWVVEGNALHVTSDGGREWTTIRPIPFLSDDDARQLNFISPQVGWAVTRASPFLLKTLDGGHTWTPVTYTISR